MPMPITIPNVNAGGPRLDLTTMKDMKMYQERPNAG